MKQNRQLLAIIISLFIFSIFNSDCSHGEVIKIKKGMTEKISGEYTATYYGFYNDSKEVYQLKLGNNPSTLTTANRKPKSMIEGPPVCFVDLEIISCTDQEISFKIIRFEKAKCKDYSNKLKKCTSS